MTQRLNYAKASPDGFKAMRQLQAHVDDCGLEHSLLELVKMRASQINGWNRLAIPFRSEPGHYQPTNPKSK